MSELGQKYLPILTVMKFFINFKLRLDGVTLDHNCNWKPSLFIQISERWSFIIIFKEQYRRNLFKTEHVRTGKLVLREN